MRRVGIVVLLALLGCDQERERATIRPARDGSVGDGATDGSFGPDGASGDVGFEDGGLADAAPTDTGIVDNWPANLAAGEEQMLVLVNQQRAQGANCGGTNFGPTHALTMNMKLRTAARLHSQDMADQNYFDHNGLDGSTPQTRIAAQGYSGFASGENIAAGNSTAQATFQQWLTSPGHCSNMMEPIFTEIGIGHAFNASSQYGDYWTQNFGG